MGGMRDEFPDDEEFDVIPAAELEMTKNAMNLSELKTRPPAELVQLGESMGLENLARSRKQDIIFSILKAHAKNGENIFGEGVLEILQDGFGFLRSADSSYLAGPDDIYVSPSQIRRFNLRTGDTISGLIRPPKDGERYFALLKVGDINGDAPEKLEEQGAVREPDAAASRRSGSSSSRATAAPRISPRASSTWSRRSAKASAA